MPEQPPRRRQSPLAVKLIAAFAVLAAFTWGRSLIVPVLIGVLVSYALNPIVETADALAPAARRWRRCWSSSACSASRGRSPTSCPTRQRPPSAACPPRPNACARVVERAIGPRHNVVQELQTAADSISKAAEGETRATAGGRADAGRDRRAHHRRPRVPLDGMVGPARLGRTDAAHRLPVVLHAVVRRSVSPQVRAAGRRDGCRIAA